MVANRNILLVRLKSMGDVLFTLPAVHVIREAFPRAKITFLVSKENAPLLEGFRDVDAMLALDRARLKSGNPFGAIVETVSLLRRLRQEKFSLAVDFHGFVETALLTWWSGAPQRWGSVYNKGRRWAYTRGVTRDYGLHPVEWNLFLLRQCGLEPGTVRNEFVLPDNALDEARRLFAAHKLAPDRPALFIQPFTSSPHKNWPLEKYLALAAHWRSRGLQIIFGGGPAERATLEPARAAGFPVSAGAPLLVSAGLMKLSTLVLGGDTGLLHLAVAMSKRVLMIMDSTRPGCCCPFQHADWTTAPAAGQPVSSIATEAVSAACEKALAGLGQSTR